MSVAVYGGTTMMYNYISKRGLFSDRNSDGTRYWPVRQKKKHVVKDLLSGMRISWGKGIVGLLSFWSTMITVSVVEPANRGLPLSVAVTTSLWVARKRGCTKSVPGFY